MKQKLLTKFNTHFMTQMLKKVDIEGIYLNIIKAIYDKPTANIILSGEKQKVFLLISGQEKDVPSSHLYPK